MKKSTALQLSGVSLRVKSFFKNVNQSSKSNLLSKINQSNNSGNNVKSRPISASTSIGSTLVHVRCRFASFWSSFWLNVTVKSEILKTLTIFYGR